MKTTIHPCRLKSNIQTLTLGLILLVSPLWIAAATFSTISDGNWNVNGIWLNGNMPSYMNGLGNSDEVNIYHDVVLDADFVGNNGFILNIHNGATLTINGDFDVGNKVYINVNGTGELIINGNFNSNNKTTVFIQGNVTVAGDMNFWNGGIINMENGNLTVGGELCGKTGTGLSIYGDGQSTVTYGSICEGGVSLNDVDIIILPIELISFSADVKDNYVEMNWVTASEINNDFFTIERSTDMVAWEILGYEQGAGNSNHMLSYTFADMMPLQGLAYYRLKQTDFDGRFEYFSPITVMFMPGIDEIDFRVVKNQSQWIIGLPGPGLYNVEVYTLNGQMIFSGSAENNLRMAAPRQAVLIRVTGESFKVASKVVM